MKLLEQIAEKLGARKQEKVDAFRDLVRDVVAEKNVTADRVESVLRDAGRTVEDLRKAADALQRRVSLAEQCGQVGPLEAEREKLLRKIEAETEKFNAAKNAYNETVAPMGDRVEKITATLRQCTEARDELMRSCDDPGRLARLSAAEKALSDIHKEATDWAAKAVQADGRASNREKGIGPNENNKAEAPGLRKAAAEYRANAKACRDKLPGLQQQHDEAQAELLRP